MPDDEQPTVVERILSAGAEIFGAGGGAAIGLLGGPVAAVGGAMAGQALGRTLSDVAGRWLSHREQARVGAVVEYAVEAITANEAAGMKIRTDGFFDGERSSGEEIAEGVLLAAKSAYEEKKLPYLGYMYAAIAAIDGIDKATANNMIRWSEELTWVELQALSVVGQPKKFVMPDREVTKNQRLKWPTWTVRSAAGHLATEGVGMLVWGSTTSSNVGMTVHSFHLNTRSLTSMGNLLFQTMCLNLMPDEELKPIYKALISEGHQHDIPDPED